MANHNKIWNDSKLQRFIQEGRGQGEGKDYKPWLTVHDQPSRGRVSRVRGWKTGRIHHFLSDNELRYFFLLEWEDSVKDIREHYPALDLYEMNGLLDDAMLNKLMDRKTGTPHILTTSFLITEFDGQGGVRYHARSIKDPKEMEKSAVIQRFELIRRYWEEGKGINWKIISPSHLPLQKALNIEWVHTAYYLDDWGFSMEELSYTLSVFMEMLSNHTGSVRKVIEQFEKELNVSPGTGVLLFRHCIATKTIGIDISHPIDLNIPAQLIEVKHIARGGEEKYATGG